MGWLNADLVQAFGVALATVIGAFTARQAAQVRKLRYRVTELETQDGTDIERFRTMVRLIRALLHHRAELTGLLAPDVKAPEPPVIPEWLATEL
ncbi:hypothetical protein DFR70_110235 [Nocardia tenerifensis]|uniref:Uncharacterized protein n=1 Tax=Nocardia tenerifensis TaxID=228006 RepID=A0A318K8L6_9NOCA|nr:hypothetical protein [Nocardia tenerifensis]PXX60393.1 hypothetical protein DFR70_110235 [Nocardia tenerifensis]